ncbi:hypothetical protein MKW98_002873, partial [Papaver atlanticum]
LFSTIADNQYQVCVRVFESISEICTEDNLLWENKLMGMPPAPKGLPQIEIDFSIDANGMLIVSNQIKPFGKLQPMTVKSSLSISDRKTDMIIREDDLHIEKDKEIFSDSFFPRMKKIAETSIYSIEKSLSEYKDKIPAELIKEIEDTIYKLRQASAGDNVDEIKAKLHIAKKGGDSSSSSDDAKAGGDSSSSSDDAKAGGDSSSSSDDAKGGEQIPEAEYEELKK